MPSTLTSQPCHAAADSGLHAQIGVSCGGGRQLDDAAGKDWRTLAHAAAPQGSTPSTLPQQMQPVLHLWYPANLKPGSGSAVSEPVAMDVCAPQVQKPCSEGCGALLALPREVLLIVLEFLDVPDLLAMSRTCHALRPLPLDPLLHRHRRAVAQSALAHNLNARPPLKSLRPPSANIYLTSTLYVARQMNRRLVGLSLDRRLRRRPSIHELIDRGVLPDRCFVLVPAYRLASSPRSSCEAAPDPKYVCEDPLEYTRNCEDYGSTFSLHPAKERSSCAEKPRSSSASGEHWVRTTASPQLLSTRRALEREALKDKLRRFMLGKGLEEVKRRRTEREKESEGVQVLARRFASREKRSSGSCDEARSTRRNAASTPARANVLRLRRFWETAGG